MSTPGTDSLPVHSPFGDRDADAPRILVADDDAVVVHTIVNALKRAGYAVTAVSDGLKAWEALTAQHYDLFLTDDQMPGLNGHELVRRARQHKLRFPIIVVSGRFDFYLEPENEEWDVAGFLRKPFSLPELMEAVVSALQRQPAVAPRRHADRAETAKPSAA